MLRHHYGSPTAFAVSCLGKEKNKIVKIFGLSLSMSIVYASKLFFKTCYNYSSLFKNRDRLLETVSGMFK